MMNMKVGKEMMTTVDALVDEIVKLDDQEEVLLKAQEDADGYYSMGKLTLDERDEIWDLSGDLLGPLRLKRKLLQKKLDRLFAYELDYQDPKVVQLFR